MDGHVGIIYDCDLISWPARGFILLHSTDESFYKMEEILLSGLWSLSRGIGLFVRAFYLGHSPQLFQS